MNFIGALNELFNSVDTKTLRINKNITDELKKIVKTEEDIVQFSQFKYLLELGRINFVYALVVGHTQDDNLLEELNYVINEFEKKKISPQIYSYFIYCVLQALKIKTDKMYWVDPFVNRLTNDIEDVHKTFGTGLFLEDIKEFDILNNTLKLNKNKRAYVTIPDGVSGVDDKVLSNDEVIEFVTLPKSLSSLPNGMLSSCSNLKMVMMTSDVKVIPQNFSKGSKMLSYVVANGVREIKAKAFEGTSISNISFLGKKQLEIIGAEAFAGCEKLKELDLTTVTEIHPLAFSNCKNITNVTLTMTSSIIANQYKFHTFFETNKNDFKKYTELKTIKVIIPNGEIPEYFFEDCVNVEEIEIVGTIKKIGAGAFRNCSNLRDLKIKFNGTVLEEEVFSGCKKLIKLPAFKTVEIISDSVFNGCASINKLSFDLIKELGKHVFQDCSQLVEVDFNYDGDLLPEYSFSGCYSLKKYDFLKKVKRIGAYALAKMTFDSSFEIPSSIKGIQTNAFDNCIFEGVLTIPKDCKINTAAFSNINRITSLIYNNLEITDLNNVSISPHVIFEEKLENFNNNFQQLVNLKINTTKIEEGAFKGWTNLRRVIMDGQFSEIPSSCFENCVNLEGIKINSDKFQIKSNAFANCRSLTKLKTNQTKIAFEDDNIIDLSLATKVEANAFNKCFGIQQVCVTITEQNVSEQFKLHTIFEEIKMDIEGKYENLHNVILNLETNVVPNYFFDMCENLMSVKIIGQLEEMSEGFFRNCTKLNSIEMEYLGSLIPKECFKNCSSLKSLSTFFYVEQIESEAFYNCSSLETIKVECEVTHLGKSSFENCVNLIKVDMVFTGELLPEKCFLNCNSVISFRFLTNISKIESYALSNITFTEDFAVPRKLDIIESYAFANSTFLDTIVLPDAKTINNLAFVNVKGFNKIEFHNLKINDLQKVEILPYKIFSDTLRDFNNNYKDVDTILIKTSNICDDAFKDWEYIKNVSISPAVKSLPNSCFEGCSKLERLKLPYYDIALGNRVFTNCENLLDVSFTDIDTKSEADNFVPIGTYHNCTKLESISISIDQTVLSSGLKLHSYFEDNLEEFNSKYQKLNSVRIRSRVQEIPESFFEGCINVEKIIILDEINTLNKNVFAYCSNLQELKMKFIGEIIPSACFLGCERLPNITNLKSVHTIEERAFERCYSLTAIQFRTPIQMLGAKAFDHCLNLEKINMYYLGESLLELTFGSCEALLTTPRLLNLVYAHNTAFEGCLNIDTVYINGIEGAIFTNVFSSSKRISKINFSSKHIPNRFFSNLRNIEELVFEERILSVGDSAFEGVKGLKTIKNLEYAESIGDYAFAHSEIEYMRISSRTKYIGVGAFAGCENIKAIEMPIRSLYVGVLFDSMNHNSTKRVTQVKHGVAKEFLVPESLELLTINDGDLSPGVFSGMKVNVYIDYEVKKIPDYTFHDCLEIGFVKPALIEEIGIHSFSNSKLNSLKFENVKEIKEFAFYASTMQNLTIGKKLEKISNTALTNSDIVDLSVAQTEKFLTSNQMLVDINKGTIAHVSRISGEITLPKEVTKLESNTFVGCNDLSCIHTNNVETIESNAFVNCFNLTTLYLDDKLTTCNEGIINNCGITNLYLPFLGKTRKSGKQLKYLINGFSEGCSFKTITITDGVLVDEPFNGCSVIETLNLQKLNLVTLKVGIFKNLSMDTLMIPKVAEKIEDYAFDNTLINIIDNKGNKNVSVAAGVVYCENKLIYCHVRQQDELTIGKTVVSINQSAFQICTSVNHLVIKNDNLLIGEALHNITNLHTLTLGDTTNGIVDMIPNCLSSLNTINFLGNKLKDGYLKGISNLQNLTFENLKELNISCINNNQSQTTMNINHLILGKNVSTIDLDLLRFLNIENISVVGNNLFESIDNMIINKQNNSVIYTSIEIPSDIVLDSNIVSVGEKAFANRENLVSINTSNVVQVANEAFLNCSALTDLVITEKCDYIGKDTLKNCANLRNISVPFVGESLAKPANIVYLFELDRLNPINSVTISNQEVIDGTFAYSKNIAKVVLGLKTTTIKTNSFNTCLDLKEVLIPSSVTSVDDYVFINCKKKTVAHVYSKTQADLWSKDWRKFNNGKFLSSIKVTYQVELNR